MREMWRSAVGCARVGGGFKGSYLVIEKFAAIAETRSKTLREQRMKYTNFVDESRPMDGFAVLCALRIAHYQGTGNQ